jgi:hypothetical protein
MSHSHSWKDFAAASEPIAEVALWVVAGIVSLISVATLVYAWAFI